MIPDTLRDFCFSTVGESVEGVHVKVDMHLLCIRLPLQNVFESTKELEKLNVNMSNLGLKPALNWSVEDNRAPQRHTPYLEVWRCLTLVFNFGN